MLIRIFKDRGKKPFFLKRYLHYFITLYVGIYENATVTFVDKIATFVFYSIYVGIVLFVHAHQK